MAKQNDEEEEGGGIMSGLKKVGGGFVKAGALAQAASLGAIQINPYILGAATVYGGYSKFKNEQDADANVPEEDRYNVYNPAAHIDTGAKAAYRGADKYRKCIT
jgi:hypothetical protein